MKTFRKEKLILEHYVKAAEEVLAKREGLIDLRASAECHGQVG